MPFSLSQTRLNRLSVHKQTISQVKALGVAFATDTSLLAGQSPLTVFAPTNEAFEALPKVCFLPKVLDIFGGVDSEVMPSTIATKLC